MPQRPVELILMQQLASCLAVPMLLLDPDGNVVFYNEAAERLVGRRFEETGEITREEWVAVFTPVNEDGSIITLDKLPLSIALRERRASHRAFRFRTLGGQVRHIEETAFPLEGQGGRFVGAVAMIWEEDAT
jgi:PAS domain-containing protein